MERLPRLRLPVTRASWALHSSWAARLRRAARLCEARVGPIGLDARVLKDEFGRAGPVQRLFLRYTQTLITQMAQTAVCNRHHSIHQKLCRWLLLSMDRIPSNELKMTQELIANMLGMRRAGVTEAAMKLQDAGLIRYSHGHIEVLDRPGLAQRVCECYGVVKREFDRLLPGRRRFDLLDSIMARAVQRDRQAVCRIRALQVTCPG